MLPRGSRPPVPMEYPEKARMRSAAFRVTRLYPGPLGQLISRELLTWEEFGYRLGGSGLILAVVDEILKTPLPEPVNPAGKSAVGYS